MVKYKLILSGGFKNTERIVTMKKQISILTAFCILTQAAVSFPACAAEYFLRADFESGL